MNSVTCPIESLSMVVSFSARDWASNSEDAWLYGVMNGWGDEALAEISVKFGWNRIDIVRLKSLHEKFLACAEINTGAKNKE